MKIGLYGGTFDPIHHGHLIQARDAVERLGLHELLLIPAAISPHKLATTPTPAEIRAEMVAAAIEGEPCFRLERCEINRPGTSYAIDTVLELRERYPAGTRFFYLIGQDNLAELHTWREIERLKQLVNFVVLSRSEFRTPSPFPTLERCIDISATEIRKRVANGQSIRYLVPEKVYDLIQRHQLYRS